MGRYGHFVACSNFPTCKNILKEKREEAEPEKTGEKCDKCGEGDLIYRKGRFGKFIACANYPKCKNTRKLTKEEQEKIKEPDKFPDGDVKPTEPQFSKDSEEEEEEQKTEE